jgi:hypothetical protein
MKVKDKPKQGSVEKQLKTLTDRHQRHQAMLEQHHEAKHERRRRHARGWHKQKYQIAGLK